MKEFVCFSSTNVFVPVSQLSTRDLFYFLENLKIKQDIFVLSLSSRSIIRTMSVMIPLFQIFWNKNVQENVNSWVFGVIFTKSIVVSILDFWHISFQKDVLNCWLVKKIITRHVLTNSQVHGLILKPGRFFFRKPTSWASCSEST